MPCSWAGCPRRRRWGRWSSALRQDPKTLALTETHRTSYRPWGGYTNVLVGDRFQVKRLFVKPGKRLSLQKHHHRSEHWVVVRGTAEVTRDGEVMMLTENQSIYLPLGATHRLANPGKILLELIEVQTGSYLGEETSSASRMSSAGRELPLCPHSPAPPNALVRKEEAAGRWRNR